MKEEVVVIFSYIACTQRRLSIVSFGYAAFQKLEGYFMNTDDAQLL